MTKVVVSTVAWRRYLSGAQIIGKLILAALLISMLFTVAGTVLAAGYALLPGVNLNLSVEMFFWIWSVACAAFVVLFLISWIRAARWNRRASRTVI